jgi:hypothetical protein
MFRLIAVFILFASFRIAHDILRQAFTNSKEARTKLIKNIHKLVRPKAFKRTPLPLASRPH